MQVNTLAKKHQILLIVSARKIIFFCILIGISVNVHADIRISGLQEIKFGIWTIGSGPLRSNNDLCVAVDKPSPYQITATGTGSGSNFQLVSGANAISYLVFFNDAQGLSGRQQLSPGIPLIGLKGKKRKKKSDCNKPTANLSIEIPESNLAAAPAGNYTGTIILVVSPE